ncbi:M1 family metallopeptidase [Lutimonas saemankumensis]|uniref:M1 family metallopeptidase n=1 Tax=Lutimonas saemankumensis TaxID=483016 RepID=UPI001CD498C7|nr:M1 family metallopeptidase [Lutimonas saemankumensis]MCA0933070.1 M1 family metallopeptidase [Lutimonas saemankumensis]
MIFRSFIAIFLLLFTINSVLAQDAYQKNKSADVLHYCFQLSLNDASNVIEGKAEIKVNFTKDVEEFNLDLVGKSGEYGMELIQVLEDQKEVKYEYSQNKLSIYPNMEGSGTRIYEVKYKGIPERGLVIDRTKYGQRSFFGDNWPNLARYWLPSVDHPYDKASVEFQIFTPDHYSVVATGIKIEESSLGNGEKLTRYIEKAPVATKVMTIGVTKFAYKYLGNVGGIAVSAWVYPENRKEGFDDFEEATRILNYFIENIGPYSYAKLANVQAKTQWGGLENAGTISYAENSITGNKGLQRLMAHEIAHQWFGDSASERSWNHVWLSEGFATYFAILYQESVSGNSKRKEELIQDRKEVIEYYKKNPSPIVDLSISDPKKVLNRNTYQKGGWVLNMLRYRLGEEVFWKGIRSYYQKFKDGNAMSSDFQEAMEEVSGEDLEFFFDQWLYQKGYPEIKWSWNYKKGKLIINLEQLQKHHVFRFPIEFGIRSGDEIKKVKFEINKSSETFEAVYENKPDEVIIDPEVWLLFDER